MPIHVEWDNAERTILRLEFSSPWTWDIYEAAVAESTRKIGTTSQPVAMIVHAEGVDSLPQGALSRFRQSGHLIPANLGEICVVTHNTLMTLLLTTLGKISTGIGLRLSLVDSLEEARRKINGNTTSVL